jgi:hypothetical protein
MTNRRCCCDFDATGFHLRQLQKCCAHGTFTAASGSIVVANVPEPSRALLLGLSLAFLMARRRR